MSKQPQIRLLSLWQPWASLCIWKNPGDGNAEKQIETRSYSTDYTGLVAIHATASFKPEAQFEISTNCEIQHALIRHGFEQIGSGKGSGLRGSFTFGAIVGVVNLKKVVQFECSSPEVLEDFPLREQHFGFYTLGRFGWIFTNPIEFKEPIYCRGLQSFGTPKPEIIEQIFEQIEVSKQVQTT